MGITINENQKKFNKDFVIAYKQLQRDNIRAVVLVITWKRAYRAYRRQGLFSARRNVDEYYEIKTWRTI